jgi:hypothetical protein
MKTIFSSIWLTAIWNIIRICRRSVSSSEETRVDKEVISWLHKWNDVSYCDTFIKRCDYTAGNFQKNHIWND